MRSYSRIHILLLCCIFSSTLLRASSSSKQAQNSAIEAIKAIFPSLGKGQKIKTSKCNIQKEKWVALLLTSEAFTETLKFNKSCDLDGQYKAEMNKFFPIKLKIRNLKGHKSLAAQVKFSLVFEEVALLKITMKKALLEGDKNLSFDMDYAVIIDVMSEDPLQKHKGGMLHLHKHGSKVLNKKVPLKF
jgi:hypothetical protein